MANALKWKRLVKSNQKIESLTYLAPNCDIYELFKKLIVFH